MTEEQLQSMSEQEIRARFRCAPDYYLQAKLEKKWALTGRESAVCVDMTDCWDPSVAEPSQRRPRRRARPQPVSLDVARGAPAALDLPLPGLEILDAALAETGDISAMVAEEMRSDAQLTQQAILEAALEDYGNWPFSFDSEPLPAAQAELESEPELKSDWESEWESAAELESEPQAESDLERRLTLVLNSEPELRRVLEAEPELEVVLHSEPELEQALDAEAGFIADNVTLAHFGNRAPRTVPVVSVVMDRKRPNMVRVVGKSTRLAS